MILFSVIEIWNLFKKATVTWFLQFATCFWSWSLFLIFRIFEKFFVTFRTFCKMWVTRNVFVIIKLFNFFRSFIYFKVIFLNQLRQFYDFIPICRVFLNRTSLLPSDFFCASFGKYRFKPFQISFFSGFYMKIMFWDRWFYSVFERMRLKRKKRCLFILTNLYSHHII